MQKNIETNLEKAKFLLNENSASFVVVNSSNGEMLALVNGMGLKPLVSKMIENADIFSGNVIADKIVGKSASMMFSLAKVVAVHAKTLSVSAREYLISKGIQVTFDNLVENIQNRTNDDICPMEKMALLETNEQALFDKFKIKMGL